MKTEDIKKYEEDRELDHMKVTCPTGIEMKHWRKVRYQNLPYVTRVAQARMIQKEAQYNADR